MKKLNWTIMLLCIVLSLGAQTPLDNYLKVAAEQNPQLQMKYKAFEKAMENIQGSKSLNDPTLNFGYFISPIETRVGAQRFKVGLSQLFPWFGTLKARSNLATKQAEAAYADFLESKNRLFLNVKLKWLELYSIREEMKITRANLEILNTYEPITKTKYEANLVSLADLVRVQIKIDEVEAQLRLIEIKSNALLSDFNTLLHREPDRQVLTTVLNNQEIFISLDSALVHHPKIKAAQSRIEATDVQISLANLRNKPNIGVGLDYAFVSERNDVTVPDNGKDIFMPMISLSLPIFKKKNQSRNKMASLRKEEAQLGLQALKSELRHQWTQVDYQIEKANTEINTYDEEIRKTNILLKVLTTEYSNNNRDFEEILNTQQLLLELQLAEIKATVELKKAISMREYLVSANLNSNR